MNFFQTASPPARRFLYAWFAITAVLVILALAVVINERGWISAISSIKADEFAAMPQVKQQITMAKQQGASDRQIEQQLLMMGGQQAAQIVSVMKQAVIWSGTIAALAAFLFWWYFAKPAVTPSQKRYVAVFLLVVMLLQLWYVAWKYIRVEPFDALYTTQPKALLKLQQAPKPFRVSVVDPGAYNLWVTMLFGLYDIECINVPADSRPTPARQKFFYSNQLSPLRRWQYSNVRYILGPEQQMQMLPGQLGARNAFAPFYTFSLDGQPHLILEYTDTLPRLFAVGSWSVITNADQALAFMNSPATDPHKQAVVMDTSLYATSNTNFTGLVKNIKEYSPEMLKADVSLSATGLVIMVTEPAPGWTATIDGAPQKIIRCNLLHQGILVPPGDHTVQFSFYQRNWTVPLNNVMYALVLPGLILITIIYLSVKFLRPNRINR